MMAEGRINTWMPTKGPVSSGLGLLLFWGFLVNGNTFTQLINATKKTEVCLNALSHLAGWQAEPLLSQCRFCLHWRITAFQI